MYLDDKYLSRRLTLVKHVVLTFMNIRILLFAPNYKLLGVLLVHYPLTDAFLLQQIHVHLSGTISRRFVFIICENNVRGPANYQDKSLQRATVNTITDFFFTFYSIQPAFLEPPSS